MKRDNSSFSSFISKLDHGILEGNEAIQLTGGFAPTLPEDVQSNYGCNTDNCTCPITNNCNLGKPSK